MLTVRQEGIFGDCYVFLREEEEIARLITGVWPRKGTFELGGAQFRLYRTGYFGGKFIAEKRKIPFACAVKPKAFKDRFTIAVGDINFELTRENGFRKTMTAWWEDEEIGTIEEGAKKIHALINLPDSLGPELQIFFFWLVRILWDRHERLSAFGG